MSKSKTRVRAEIPTADSANPTPAEAAPARIDPFAHAGKPGWGVGGRYVVTDNGTRIPVNTKEGRNA